MRHQPRPTVAVLSRVLFEGNVRRRPPSPSFFLKAMWRCQPCPKVAVLSRVLFEGNIERYQPCSPSFFLKAM